MSDEIIDTTTRPWAGRFSRQYSPDEQERHVIYLPLRNSKGQATTVEQHAACADEDQAVSHCQSLIDDYLSQAVKPGMCGSALFELYRHEGPDPYIVLESGTWWKLAYQFDAWHYAKAASYRLCNEEQPEASLTLADLKGRYSEYNRLQLAGHLLLDREVRVIRPYEGVLLTVTSGTTGHIGLGSPYISGWEFDWSVELPVVFEREGMDAVTFGIPYELLEFTQSDKEHLEMKAALRAQIRS
jgi:hypothetical protein